MSNIYPFLFYAFVTTFTPGPNNIMSMSNAMHHGYKKTLRFLAGIFTGFLVVMFLCGLLNVALTTLLPSLNKWLNILGAIYMLYLSIHILRSKPVMNELEDNGFNTYKAGLTMQFLNIKVILYGITVFSLFIIGSYRDPTMIFLFSFLLASLGFVATSCWAFGGNLFRNLPQQDYRIFNFVMGGLLVYTAIACLFQ